MGLFILALGSWRWFIRPAVADPQRADAVVLFAGGRGERLDTALDLLGRGVGSALVLPNGNLPHWEAANRLCSEPQAFDVHCFTPDPDSTLGEARGIAFLAEANGWNELVAVTSTYHATRVKLLLGRCTDADIDVVGATPDISPFEWTTRIGHEWLGMGGAYTFRRGC